MGVRSVFNTHGLIHTQNVLNNFAKLLYPIADKFSEEDYLIAYISTILHDFGMMPVNYNDDMEQADFRTLRSNHAKTIAWWVMNDQLIDLLELNDDEKAIFNNIKFWLALTTLHHDCHYSFNQFYKNEKEPKDDKIAILDLEVSVLDGKVKSIKDIPVENKKTVIGDFKKEYTDDKKLEKRKYIAGLMALADKLDFNETRVPVSVVKNSPYRSLFDELAYLSNMCMIDYELGNQYLMVNIFKPENIDLDKIDGSFNSFVEEIEKNNGEITDTILAIASKSLKNNLEGKFEIIKNCLKDEEIDFNYIDKIETELKYCAERYKKIQDSGKTIFRDTNRHRLPCKTKFKKKGYSLFDINMLKSLFQGSFDFVINDSDFVKTGLSKENVIHIKSPFRDNYKSNSLIIKTGKYGKIHQEVYNYKKFAVPYINPRNLIGMIEEFKYMDRGAYFSYVTPLNSIDLDSKLRKDNFYENFEKEKELIIPIDKSLSIFYDKILPFKDVERQPIFKIDKKKYNVLIKIYDEKNIEFMKELEKQLEKEKNLTFSISHQDFTFRNILLIDKDYIFIDFAKTGINHFFYDFATLERFIILERFLNKELKVNEEYSSQIINCYMSNDFAKRWDNQIARNILLVRQTIEQFAKEKLKKNKIETDFKYEMNLARLIINIKSLSYKKDEYPLPKNRLELVKYFWKKINE